MIELNFLESNDQAILGPYKSLKDVITIGKSLKNDIIIRDPDLFPIHLYIELTPNGLIVWNEKGDYFSNEKLYRGKKIHVKNDKIKIASSLFEIIDYAIAEKENPDELLKAAYPETTENYPHQAEVIDEIENEMSHLEDLIND